MTHKRDVKDFAIEFGEYLAKEAESFLKFFNTSCLLKDTDSIHELSDRFAGLQSAIYEFRKRSARVDKP